MTFAQLVNNGKMPISSSPCSGHAFITDIVKLICGSVCPRSLGCDRGLFLITGIYIERCPLIANALDSLNPLATRRITQVDDPVPLVRGQFMNEKGARVSEASVDKVCTHLVEHPRFIHPKSANKPVLLSLS